MADDRPALSGIDVSGILNTRSPEEALRLPRIYGRGRDGYTVIFGFGGGAIEYEVDGDGASRQVLSGLALAIRRCELADLPAAVEHTVVRLTAEHRAAREHLLAAAAATARSVDPSLI